MLVLNSLTGNTWMVESEGEYIVPHSYPLMARTHEERQKLLIDLPQKHGIEARQLFYSIPTQCEAYAFLGEKFGTYPVAEDVGNHGFYLPCHQNITDEKLKYIGKVIRSIS